MNQNNWAAYSGVQVATAFALEAGAGQPPQLDGPN